MKCLRLPKIRDMPVWALVWLYMKERTRRITHTIWEIVSGLLFFTIMIMINRILHNERKKSPNIQRQAMDLIYTPFNKWTDELMNEVCFNINTKINPHPTDSVRHCYGFDNNVSLRTFLRTKQNLPSYVAAVIQFEDTLPANLKYTVTSMEPLISFDSKYSDWYEMHNVDFYSLQSKFYANLQWEINKVYMEKVMGNKIEHAIELNDVMEHITPQMHVVHNFLIMCTVLGPLPFFLYTSSKLRNYRYTGLGEMIKFAGVSANSLRAALFLETTAVAFVYAVLVTILIKITSHPVLPTSNIVVLIIMFVLHILSVTALVFNTSLITQNYQHSSSAALLIYILTILLNLLWYKNALAISNFSIYIFWFIPHAPVFLFWDDVIALENLDEGPTFMNIFVKHKETNSGPFIIFYVLFIAQIITYTICSWYLEKVKPGRYGIAEPLNFLFRKRYWRSAKKRTVNFHMTAEHSRLKDDRFFEAPPFKKSKVAIRIATVSKGFRKGKRVTMALDSVNFDVYRGEITILLGRNGAGKTTLISIITGMYSASKGIVYINGLDNSSRLKDLKKDLAYCPQNNLTFDQLTVKENLIFFQRIRGKRIEESYANVEKAMIILKMSEVADYYSYQLSDGMRRCLQVACMLVCDAEVLVCDEPTAGMDAQMRHNIWDVFLSLRKQKTLFISTTVMEEAEALGDRIALINRGKLKCHGSPLFLKQAIGAGFNLSVRLENDQFKLANTQDLIKMTLESAGVHREPSHVNPIDLQTASIVTVNIPAAELDLFPKVFDILEAKKEELGIASMDVGISMEQIFLRFVEEDENLDTCTALDDHTYDNIQGFRLKGYKLRFQQLRALARRSFLFIWVHRYLFFILKFVIPFLALIILTNTSNTADIAYSTRYLGPFRDMFQTLSLVMYQPVGLRRSTKMFKPLLKLFPQTKFTSSLNVQEDITKILKTQVRGNHLKRLILGIKMHNSRTQIFYPFSMRQGPSQAVNLLSNMYMTLHMANATSRWINSSVVPLEEKKAFNEPKNLYLTYAWSLWVAFLVSVPLTPLILICVEEAYTGVRFNHFLAGCPPYIIWLSKLVTHMAVYVATVPITVVLVAALLDTDSTIDQVDFLVAAFILIIVYGLAFLIHWYALSFVMSRTQPISKIYVMSFGLGFLAPVLSHFVSEIPDFHGILIFCFKVLYVVSCMFPAFAFAVGFGKISVTARNNAFCKLNFHLCPNSMINDIYVSKRQCCESKNGVPFTYFSGFSTGAVELGILSVHIVVYWIILILLERHTLQCIAMKVMKIFYKSSKKIHASERIQMEEQYVNIKMEILREQSIKNRQQAPDSILAKNLQKVYNFAFSSAICAVKNISFSVRKGECLGILGKCGAGKSTALAMVTGFLTRTAGELYIDGYFYHNNRSEYLHSVSWVTSNGLDEFLTAYKNLELLAMCYGYTQSYAQMLAVRYLNYMGLTSYSETLFSMISPGCSQRLVLCNALFGDPKAALFDEPCGCVDPHARPLVIRAIKRLLKSGTACVIAEESAVWRQIDIVCTRLAILDKGEFVALGSVAEIRKELGSGYTVTIKLKIDLAYCKHGIVRTGSLQSILTGHKDHGIDSEVQSSVSLGSSPSGHATLIPVDTTNNLKREFLELFETSLLVDEHLSMLHFHIRDPQHKLLYSEMFKKLEFLKTKYNIIQYYILSEVSIDELLLRLDNQLRKCSHTGEMNSSDDRTGSGYGGSDGAGPSSGAKGFRPNSSALNPAEPGAGAGEFKPGEYSVGGSGAPTDDNAAYINPIYEAKTPSRTNTSIVEEGAGIPTGDITRVDEGFRAVDARGSSNTVIRTAGATSGAETSTRFASSGTPVIPDTNMGSNVHSVPTDTSSGQPRSAIRSRPGSFIYNSLIDYLRSFFRR